MPGSLAITFSAVGAPGTWGRILPDSATEEFHDDRGARDFSDECIGGFLQRQPLVPRLQRTPFYVNTVAPEKHVAVETDFRRPPSLIKRGLRLPTPTPPSKSQTRIRYVNGKRNRRDVPLTANDLYLDDERPATNAPVAGHRSTGTNVGIATAMSVYAYDSNGKGRAPTKIANSVIRKAPVVDVGEAESLVADYPDRVDKSRVTAPPKGALVAQGPDFLPLATTKSKIGTINTEWNKENIPSVGIKFHQRVRVELG
ncbi:hypothetical protein B0H14DRAFT_3546223 [Mycena olivaceomarginata]|nr:hypothetical protein B0H14DRAFT_3546223 [Mycena olivaceomarginata]